VNKKSELTTAQIKSNPARWQRLKNILADALEQTSFEERTAVLRRSCADDTALLREAEKLLAHDTTAFEEFAEFSATRLRHDERDRIGERIGAYAIVRELGRGGMGAVYLAERADGQFEKRVAIKVLKRGTDTDEVLRRFRIERQILANLEHPNITRLLDAGTTNDGLPYFVMEFIEGTPITQFVQLENIDLRGRLELFLKICSAVNLAHQNQIIHRDIKPTNVLVKRDGEPKLLDFGIAKLLDVNSKDADITMPAERRLTPLYASPEQNAGQSTTIASDVYSLGALLYELLTAQPPRRNSDSTPSQDVEFEHLIAPPLPSQVVTDPKTKQQLQGQLDQIVATATRRDPAQRYSSAAGLAEDIERYLNGAAPRSDLFSRATTAAESGSRNLNLAARSRRRWYITAAALAMIVIAAAVVLPRLSVSWLEKHGIAKATPATSPANVKDTVRSIAVLPFEPLGQDMNDELLGLGMADAVIGRMSSLKQLVVLPTSAVSKYKGTANDPLAAGRALGVDAILSGTVQRSGEHIRATVQLVNVRDGHTVWSEKFDQTFTDVFGIQDSISDSVARSLALNLTADEQKQLRKHYTTNAAAYDSYLMGLYFWGQRSKDGLEKAINYFQQAVEKDSNFALAYALMADCYYLQVYYRYNPAPETIANANAAAERALLLDDSVAEGHVARAMVQSLQKNGHLTMESLRRALELNPNLGIAHLRYAWCLSAFGQLHDSVREMKRAQELDPLSPTNNAALGIILVYARQFPASLDYCYKAAELAPNEAPMQENLAIAYALNGMYQQAIEHYQRVGELNPEKKGDVLAWVATVLVSAGRKPEADSMLPEILDFATAGKADPYNIAVLYAARGEKKSAFEWLAKALETSQMIDPLIRYDPQLDALRSDSRFAALLRQRNRALLLDTP
jgi:serine/threonine protein kinase/tetratricopeptide (TPR) repeat protein